MWRRSSRRGARRPRRSACAPWPSRHHRHRAGRAFRPHHAPRPAAVRRGARRHHAARPRRAVVQVRAGVRRDRAGPAGALVLQRHHRAARPDRRRGHPTGSPGSPTSASTQATRSSRRPGTPSARSASTTPGRARSRRRTGRCSPSSAAGSRRSSTTRRRWRSTGLARNSAAPARMATTAWSNVAWPESTITGSSGRRFRTSAVSSRPSAPGTRWMSVTTTSTSSAASTASAASVLGASSTRAPASLRSTSPV